MSDQEKGTESIPTDQHDAQHARHQEETGQPKDTPFEEEVEDDDENETCGFCIFMKGGGCRKEFIAWSKCVDSEREAGKDYTEECKETTLRLRECMLAHRDYYAPLLEEEEAELEAARQAQLGEEDKKEGESI